VVDKTLELRGRCEYCLITPEHGKTLTNDAEILSVSPRNSDWTVTEKHKLIKGACEMKRTGYIDK
jgi:hypothetical protein